MCSNDGHDKEPKIPKLTKENCEKWFHNNKLKLKGKGIFYTIEVTKHAYAWIARLGAGTSTSTATTTPTPADFGYAAELASDFERLGGTWNAEKAKEYDKDEAKARAFLHCCEMRKARAKPRNRHFVSYVCTHSLPWVSAKLHATILRCQH
jgi:hypothetical protein